LSIGLLKNSAAKRPKKLKVSHNVSFLSALPWIGPALLLILLVVIWPVIELIRTSFTDISLAGSLLDFNGLVNYRDLLANVDLYPVAKRTLFWVFGIVFFTVLLSLPLAQLINQNFPGRKYVRWAMIFPWAASVVMTSMIWTWILDAYSGELNLTLTQLGLISEPVDWVNNPGSSFYFLMWVAVFVSIPFTTFVLLAGLQSIPQDIIEAASVDGATKWQQFKYVTLPSLKNTITFVLIVGTIGGLQVFAEPQQLAADGGSTKQFLTLTLFLYNQAFLNNKYGYAAAIGIAITIIVLIISAINFVITRKLSGEGSR
jgi:ABC-type sugar transport system permease subunit